MPWVTVERTAELTGVAVQAAELAQAQGVVDLYAGVTEADLAHLGGRDRRLLGQAVAYQAAWLAAQADAFTRTDVTSINQDGVAATFRGEEALLLAPLAQRCLARLSWRKAGSVRVGLARGARPVFGTLAAAQDAFLRDADGSADWRPL